MDEQMELLVKKLNDRMIHPEKDYDLLLDELQEIGLVFGGSEKGWYYDNDQ